MKPLFLVDTHTGGEPTRVVFNDGEHCPVIDIQDSTEARRWLQEKADWIRRSILLEPRGSESMVGAWVTPLGTHRNSDEPTNGVPLAASIVFFNNTGYLGMCGHGLIGVVEAMRYRGDIEPGPLRFATPAGEISAELHADSRVSFENVPSYRYLKDVQVSVDQPNDPSGGISFPSTVTGDVAYGGNWFFLIKLELVSQVDFSQVDTEALLRYSQQVKAALVRDGITGEKGAEIDHIEICQTQSGSPRGGRAFVLCPGGHYDRSPCGTGTSAKVACLAADGDLRPGETWAQTSIIGSQFTAAYRVHDGQTRVTVTGRAFVNGETKCVFDEQDAFRFGIPATGEKSPDIPGEKSPETPVKSSPS